MIYKSGIRSNIQTPSDKMMGSRMTRNPNTSSKPTVKQIQEPVINNLFMNKIADEIMQNNTNENMTDKQSSGLKTIEGNQFRFNF